MAEEKSNTRAQWDKLKGQPFSEKLRYVLEYYGIFIGLGAFVLLLCFLPFMYGACAGGNGQLASGIVFDVLYDTTPTAINDAICEKLGEDSTYSKVEFQPVSFDQQDPVNVFDEQESIYARIAAGDLDFMIGKAELLSTYIDAEDWDQCSILSVDEILPEDLIEKLEKAGRLFYTETTFGGPKAFMIRVSDSYLSRGFDTPLTDYFFTIACKTERKDAIIAMCELLVE